MSESEQGVGASSDQAHGRKHAEPPGPDASRRDMFGAAGFGDTSGFGGLAVRPPQLVWSPKPYGGWFDEATTALEQSFPEFGEAIERVVVHRGELTLFVKREAIVELCRLLRDDPQL